jgi:two-component system, OmpR family, phosphate regulon response regulator OmpR
LTGDVLRAADGERHLLVVDDDPRLLRLLGRYLGEQGFRVTTAADAFQARAAQDGLTFDLIVLDVMLPDGNGVDLTREWRRSSQVPILLLTARGEARDRIDGLEAGADDYLVKPFEPRELLLRVDAILRRARPERPVAGPVRFGPFTFEPDQGVLRQGEEVVHLTGVEQSLLRVLALQPGLPISRAELGLRSRISGSDRAVDTQIVRLRRKLEPDPRQPRWLLTMRGEGYVLRTGA